MVVHVTVLVVVLHCDEACLMYRTIAVVNSVPEAKANPASSRRDSGMVVWLQSALQWTKY